MSCACGALDSWTPSAGLAHTRSQYPHLIVGSVVHVLCGY